MLYTLAGDVPGNGGVLALAADLIQLINVNDAPLRPLHVKIRCLQQAEQDVFHILAHVAGLGQRRGVGDGEGDVQHPRHRLGKQRFPAAGGSDQQNIALLQLHIVVGIPAENALVMVVNGDRQRNLGPLLPHDIIIQNTTNFRRLRQFTGVNAGKLS